MIRIGDFSKLSRVSIKALRLYDELGLLKPLQVDRFTGYRYYDFHQLPRLYRILALKDLGFSLEEVGRLLEDKLSNEQMRGMLRLRQAEARQRVAEESARLERVERWLSQVEQEENMSNYDVVLKRVEPLGVAAVRGVVPTPPDQGALWAELMDELGRQQARMIGPPISVYHDPEYKERDWDIEVCMPLAGEIAPTGQVAATTLPGIATAACVVHSGPFTTISEAYDALARWIGENGYRISGPARELNLRVAEPTNNQNDPNTVTEIQFPVSREE